MPKHLSRIEKFLIVIIVICAGYLYTGFLYPDPYIIRTIGRHSPLAMQLVVWGTRIGIPIAVLMVLGLYIGMRKGRISGVNIAVMAVSACLAVLIAYPVASWFYYRSSSIGKNALQYHPYLQLTPSEFVPRHDATADNVVIMCLGGSTTEFRDSSGKDWPGRVEDMLRQRYSNPSIYIYNTGRQWYSTQHILIHYTANLRRHKPDLIIVMEAINDLLHNADFSYLSFRPFRPDYGHFYGPMKRIMTQKTLEAALIAKLPGLWRHTPRQILDQTDFPGLASFQQNINTLIDLAILDSTAVMMMTQPNLYKDVMTDQEIESLEMLHYEAIGERYQWSLKNAGRGMSEYNDLIRKIAADRNAALIDLEKEIPKTLEYFYDDVHYRDIAFDRVASTVANGIERSGIIEQKMAKKPGLLRSDAIEHQVSEKSARDL
ncbi:MAG: SGNH/GDSL hydrolase family protein [Desulfatirhabdiaceae bacterium]